MNRAFVSNISFYQCTEPWFGHLNIEKIKKKFLNKRSIKDWAGRNNYSSVEVRRFTSKLYLNFLSEDPHFAERSRALPDLLMKLSTFLMHE